MSNVSLADHYKSVRARMGMAAPRPVVRPVLVAPAAVVVSPSSLIQMPKPLWEGRRLSFAQIQSVVAKYYDVTRDGMISPSRKRRYSLPRHVAIYLCRKLTKFSLPQIGKQFGRHHTTVLNSIRRVEQMVDGREDFAGDVAEIEFLLTGKWPQIYWGA